MGGKDPEQSGRRGSSGNSSVSSDSGAARSQELSSQELRRASETQVREVAFAIASPQSELLVLNYGEREVKVGQMSNWSFYPNLVVAFIELESVKYHVSYRLGTLVLAIGLWKILWESKVGLNSSWGRGIGLKRCKNYQIPPETL